MHVCMEFLFVYFVTQCIHALSHPYMRWISFLKSFYEDLFLFCYAVLPTHLRFMRHRSLSDPAKVVGPRENKLPSPQESASGKSVSLSCSQSKTQKAPHQRISWLVVAVSNATRIALRRYKLFVITSDRFKFATLK